MSLLTSNQNRLVKGICIHKLNFLKKYGKLVHFDIHFYINFVLRRKEENITKRFLILCEGETVSPVVGRRL